MKTGFANSLVALLTMVSVAVAQVPARKAVLLDDGSLMEGNVDAFDTVVRISPATGSARIVLSKQVAFVGETREAVYEYVAGKVDAKSADGARQLAAWCEKAGLIEKALLHARTVVASVPDNRPAKEMVARLEKALAAKPKTEPKKPEAEQSAIPELTAGAGIAFAAKIQPILSNQCASCHADRNHAGAFKLSRIAQGYANPEAVAANLKAVTAQLSAANSASSPLLAYSVVAHGGQKRAAFANRESAAFQNLEEWVLASLPRKVVPPGFVAAALSPVKLEEPPAALPGAIVGATGRPVAPPPPAPTLPPSAVVPPPPSVDPFDPNTFNRLPKKSAK